MKHMMINSNKAILTFVTIVILMIGVGGWMQNNPVQNNQKNINDVALEYMEQKYGEQFVYISLWSESYSYASGAKFLVKCESLPEEILVNVEKNEDGYHISDNYLAVKYKQSMYNVIKSATDKTFGISFVFYDVLKKALSPELLASSSFEEYSKEKSSIVSPAVIIPISVFDEKLIRTFAENIFGFGISAQITFAAIDDDVFDILDTITFEEAVDKKHCNYFFIIDIYENEITITSREVN